MSIGPIDLIARILAFATAIPLHEAAHAFVSDKLGDPTARNMGRLTLNPLKHLDPWGLVAMLTIGFGWAKPVPVNPGYYKNRKKGMALTAAAGPLSNLVLAYLGVVVSKLVVYIYLLVAAPVAALPTALVAVMQILDTFAGINVVLAVFNLLPIPPFDGSRIVGLVLPERLYFGIQRYERIIMGVMLVLLFFGAFSGYLNMAYRWVITALNWLTGYIDVFFGLFL